MYSEEKCHEEMILTVDSYNNNIFADKVTDKITNNIHLKPK